MHCLLLWWEGGTESQQSLSHRLVMQYAALSVYTTNKHPQVENPLNSAGYTE